jgi:DNA-binding MarR family transcriptional regulator
MKPSSVLENLERLSLAELDAEDTLNLVQQALHSKIDNLNARVFEALRSNTWKLLTARIYGEDMRKWHDVFRKCASLFASIDPVASIQIRVLSDMALESARFGSINSLKEMLSKEHVAEILQVIEREGGQAKRAKIIELTGLRQANLSRILANMSAVGLVDRDIQGREVALSLTVIAKEHLKTTTRTPQVAPQLAPRLVMSPPIRRLEPAD